MTFFFKYDDKQRNEQRIFESKLFIQALSPQLNNKLYAQPAVFLL